jgi:glycosyltransferase involved in cell wall biosynthesis
MTTNESKPTIVYLTAGAGGMFCGSCMHDNALSRSLVREGWDIQLIPTYTPIRTDESNASVDQVFFGGINVFLQQKIPIFRYLPASLDRFLDNPKLIRRVTAKAMDTDAKTLGKLSVSMLKGMDGNQRKEVRRICEWLIKTQPRLMVFSNILIGGCIEEIKQRLGLPIVVTLQGDDVFLDSLQEPWRTRALDRITEIASHVDAFIVHSNFYRKYISEYLNIPIEKFHVTPLGLELDDFDEFRQLSDRLAEQARVRVLGYLARLAPEKGLHHLVDAFLKLKQDGKNPDLRLRIAGWLSPQNRDYADEQFAKLDAAGLKPHYEYVGAIERDEKLSFLKSLDLFCVPTEFLEPKALYALESLAAGVPVVAPDHGAFPELAASTKGIRLFAARNVDSLADALDNLMSDPELRVRLGQIGQAHVFEHRNAHAMAKSTGDILAHLLEAQQSVTGS